MYSKIQTLNNWSNSNISIKGKVQAIKHFKTYTNKEAMSIKIKDVDNTEIHCIFWQNVYHKFKKIIQQHKTYAFKHFRIQKVRYPRFNQTQHDYEIIVTDKTTVKKVVESVIVKVKKQQVECVQLHKRKRDKKRKLPELKRFYGLKCPQTQLTDFYRINNKKQKISKMKTNKIIQNCNNKQPMITNFFKFSQQ